MKKHIPLVISLIFCIIASSCTNSEQTGIKASTSLPEITTQHEKNNDINEIIQSQHSDSAVAAVESEEILPTKQKIKVNADELIVRETKSKDSKMIGKVPAGTIFEVMDEGRDDEGGLWYKINYEFGVTGWIAGWHCESTDEKVNYCIKSEPGKMLSEFENNDLLVELLLLGEYSLDSLIQRYGKEYTLKKEYGNDVYEYPNGININVTDEGFTSKVGIYDFSFYVNSIKTKTCDIYENEGEEILVIYEYYLHHRLLVLDAGSKEVIEEYDLSYLEVFQLEVGDFFNNGKLELYIDGSTNGLLKREIYRVAEDDFFRVYDISSFDLYREGIKAKIDKNDLRLDIDIGKYSMHEISVLPDRIFFNTSETKDKNKLLSIDHEWHVEKKDDKWLVLVRYVINIVMLEYYWGPPGEDTEMNAVMQNDLARFDIQLKMQGDIANIQEVLGEVKYNDPSLLNIKTMMEDEVMLASGPALGMSLEDAVASMGGNISNFENANEMYPTIEIDGISMSEFCSEIVEITVNNDKYMTSRGIRIGDTIQTVEKLYGKPDIGFSGDDSVEYKSCYYWDNKMQVGFYRGLIICYKNGLISSFSLFQIILD